MKAIYKVILSIFILMSFYASAQPPSSLPFQSVARNSSGEVMANQNISVRFSIRDSIANGVIIYRETQSATTNALGLFTLEVGRGTSDIGNFAAIVWSKNAKYMQVELDTIGGSNYINMGTNELLSVPYALFAESSNFYGVIYDTSLMVINTTTQDTVFYVDKTGKSRHKGKESFYGGVWIYNDSLVVINEFGEIVFLILPDGRSYHYGHEYFDDGITVGDPDGAHVIILPDGSIQVVDAAGNVVFDIAPNGDSYHAGFETFAGGAAFGIAGGSYLGVGTDGSIAIYDANGNEVFSVDADGTSHHAGIETFGDPNGAHVTIYPGGRIDVFDAAGNITTQFLSDGTSYHAGVETFAGGLAVGIPGGSYLSVAADGTIRIVDASGNVVFSVSPDGTSYHKGLETFAGGAIIGDPNGAHVMIYPGGRIDIFDANGNITTQFLPDGKSYHAGKETFAAGLAVGLPGGSYLGVGPDGTLQIVDAGGNVVFSVSPDGTSYHKGLETFSGGIAVNNSNLSVTGLGVISGNGSEVSNLNASNITDGTIGNLHTTGTSSNVANTLVLRDGLGNFSAGTMTGTFSGSGASLTGLPASSISTGTLNDSRLSLNIPRQNTANVFSQSQVINANSPGTSLQCSNGGGGPAAIFNGNVQVNGNLSKASGSFKIDHPLDPTNKFLYHSFVESPDMMNIYNGNALLDENGKATVQLPDWFGALNKNFRYQLTPIGASGPDLFVAEEVQNNSFKIAGGKPGMKVSWMVTGVRQDAYAEKNPIRVEEIKPVEERGTYLYPEAFKK